jgi:hypothetical protein
LLRAWAARASVDDAQGRNHKGVMSIEQRMS